MALKKGTFKHIESELYSYKDTLKQIAELEEEILHGSTNFDENVGGGRSSFVSQPTESKAIRLATNKELIYLSTITNAIEKTYKELPDTYQELMKIKYFTKPQILTWDGIADKLYISRRQAMRWRDEIVMKVAAELGWR